MKRARWVVIVLAVVFVVALSAVCLHVYNRHGSNQQAADNEDAYYAAEETLLKYLGVDDKKDDASGSDEEIVADLSTNSRFTQRVTVKDDNDEMLPYSGTITKDPDSFYPGTYEISFNQNDLLPNKATVEVEMDVLKGDEVYILTGDKDSGYTEYAVVTVDKYNTVRFSTDMLQTYTLSTTNIAAAQEAMAGIVGD
ncbi:hypothetical protein [Butyrivibrio sp. M55]|uniref:hypothetical protein n=1 Tax=Butyrivibrio sp. M55 TaxID=1855323 RepID=UPI0008E01629|nr:hypothetical protein [Butyrivibrio sp. M55]SFU63848.1 hypothetical protein SAMN05216540_10515 [Butyrivibrio sp. M55]